MPASRPVYHYLKKPVAFLSHQLLIPPDLPGLARFARDEALDLVAPDDPYGAR